MNGLKDKEFRSFIKKRVKSYFKNPEVGITIEEVDEGKKGKIIGQARKFFTEEKGVNKIIERLNKRLKAISEIEGNTNFKEEVLENPENYIIVKGTIHNVIRQKIGELILEYVDDEKKAENIIYRRF